MKIKAWKASSNKGNYRTPLDEVDGMPEAPVEGKRLLLTSSTHDSGGILTSEVKFIETQPNGYIIVTENSRYHIEVMKPDSSH